MSEFDYSSDALNVLSAFYAVRFVVFVEGQDDVMFWQAMFKYFGYEEIMIKDVGGASEIEKIEQFILEEDAQVIVARDADYRPFNKDDKTHERIIQTYGYSIENTLYHPDILGRIICKLQRCHTKTDVGSWLNDFATEIKDLLVLDLASYLFNKGVDAISNSCDSLLKGRKSPCLDPSKITARIQQLNINFTEEEITISKEMLDGVEQPLYKWIPGHFLTAAIIRYVKKCVFHTRRRRITISHDNLYAVTLTELEKGIPDRREHSHFEKTCNSAASNLMN